MASITLAVSHAQEKPAEEPRVLMCVPLGALPGEPTKLTARGLKLEGATEVKSSDSRAQVKLLSQGKANVPNNQKPEKVGDNQVEFELVVPGDFPAGNVELTFVTPKGEAKYILPIGGEHPAVAEKEPNPGFKQSQPVQLPQTVVGRIENPLDVDVYSLDVQAGQTILCKIHAERLGSGLDALLTIYDAAGLIVATHDDLPDSPDARLEFTASSAGKYFVVVQDANDQGGPAHPYRLALRVSQ
jgi:hypothetical protein